MAKAIPWVLRIAFDGADRAAKVAQCFSRIALADAGQTGQSGVIEIAQRDSHLLRDNLRADNNPASVVSHRRAK